MESRLLIRRVFLILLFVVGLQTVIYAQFLPPRVAYHFDAAGHATGWLSRDRFIIRQGIFFASIPVLFLLLPRLLILRWPAALTSRRASWLAAENRQEAAQRLDDRMLWLGLASLAFVFALTELLFDANRQSPPLLNIASFWRWLIAYVAFIGVWAWRTWVLFRVRKPNNR